MTGIFEHSLDSAGRLIVPAKLRDSLGTTFYLAAGTKENITMYPMDAWNRLLERVSQLSNTEAEDMDLFFACAQQVEVDKQYRFQLSPYLKGYANIDRDIVITGNNDRAQIWNADSWKQKTKQELNPKNIASLMRKLGI